MEDRDSKKPFIIPKTHTSTKNVVISEKPDSRNVTELFDDIKSCALEAQFDFRPNGCKSCDTIRNQKLQKLYNEKRIKMKKDQDPIERLAFHLITYRDVALNVANNGIQCEQLSFPIDKHLGNPKDGVHLSKRPDVLLTSSGAQGLYRFGLLVCKILLGKGYATIPSETNNQLSAQLYYDHHFCKIQSINKEQRHIDDLLANSLIFCYEHENFETVSRPPQILPIAILWYDLTEKFSPELLSIITIKSTPSQESQRRTSKTTNKETTIKTKTSDRSTIPISSTPAKPTILNSGTWDEPTQDTTTNDSTVTKYPNHFMVPYHRLYSNTPLTVSTNIEDQQTNCVQSISTTRDPRLLRARREISLETIPLSPQHLLLERSQSECSPSIKSTKSNSSDEYVLITRSTSSIYIPLNTSVVLIDPRLKTVKQTRNIFYLEFQSVKHALQQQKRLNHYYDPKSGLPPKTSYTLVPYVIHEVSNNEYERLLNDNHTDNMHKFTKHSNGIDYSSLGVSVVDCFNFGLLKSTTDNQLYIDLEQNENRLAYEQIEISNDLIQREKQLNSQQIRLRLREKRQRRIQQHINEKKNSKSLSVSPSSSSTSGVNTKLYVTNGRQLLKEHKVSTISPNKTMSSDLLDFFSREYKNENRSHVKHLLAELVGVFIEKYQVNSNEINQEKNPSTIEDINSVIDMDIDSPSSQGLNDHDERFRALTPPPPLPPPLSLPPLPTTNISVYTQSLLPLTLIPTLPNEPNKIFNDPNYNDRCHKLLEQLEQYRQKETQVSNILITTKSEEFIPTEEAVLKACLRQLESSSSENSPINDNHLLTINETLQDNENILIPLVKNDSNRSRDEFVKLLTKEAYISKSSSPTKNQNKPKHSDDNRNQRRRSYDDDDNNNNTNKKSSVSKRSNSSQRYTRPSDNSRHDKSGQKSVSSNRTVTLVSNRSTISSENQNEKQTIEVSKDNQTNIQEEPIIKRIKVDSISSPTNTTNEIEHNDKINQNDSSIKSKTTVPTITNDRDYRNDLNGKRRTISNSSSSVLTTDNSKTKLSRSRSRSKSKDRHRRRSPSNSHSTSIKNSTSSTESNKKSSKYSQSSSSSSTNNRRRSQQGQQGKQSFNSSNHNRKNYSNQISDRHELFTEIPYRNSLSSVYQQRNMNDLIPSNSVHHLQQRQQPVRHKRFNYNHQSVAEHPRFANANVLPTPPPALMDFKFSKSPPVRRHNASPITATDRNVNSSYYKNKYNDQSESTKTNYSNGFDSKPSKTIENLQLLLQNKTNESYPSLSTNNDTAYWSSTASSPSSSSSHSSKTKSDTITQNNPRTFTHNDSEKVLSMIQRSRN
ncbi:unnamed protein product [Adineta steineri]|uniref:Uncharacterized protein n=1 Tax=Adineta steineri TaxID=433720 RepID=A0A815AU09_9BILA|nr:unnamed protein product [Adineta steineri]CAF3785309.1 unnamed protein product [Adineta steineri]